MPLVSTRELLDDAMSTGTGLGALNVLHVETAEAIAAGAEAAGRGAIMQLSQNCIRYHGALAPIAAATTAVAEASTAPLAVHLDHATDADLVTEALSLGFSSVMFDGSTLPWEDNVAQTRRAVHEAAATGALVEAELGEVGGKDGAHAPGVRTDPLQATQFVAATGIDLLAVAVGSSHAMTERTAAIDLDLIARLDAAVEVPLVLHGSSGVPDAALVEAIGAGMRKINLSTQLNKVFTQAVRERLGLDETVDSRRYLGAGRDAMAAEVERLLRLFATAAAPR